MELDVIYTTDALSGLRKIYNGSVDCIVTSPPYWQLRDYGLQPILFGGKVECSHDLDEFGTCRICSGWVGQLGQEPSREGYISHLIEIFCECHRVLKKSGTLWVNLGDSYCKVNKYNHSQGKWGAGKNSSCLTDMKENMSLHHIPNKSLCNIPGRFAEEMIASGWILRNEIIWYKPSVIPSPVTDRFTVDFEKFFFFSKSQSYDFRQQFEPYAESTIGRYKRGFSSEGKIPEYRRQAGAPVGKHEINPKGRNMRAVWRVTTECNHEEHYAAYPAKLIETPIEAGCPPGGVVLDPFLGSGTTALVARRLGRHFIGIEPNPNYVAISERRLKIT